MHDELHFREVRVRWWTPSIGKNNIPTQDGANPLYGPLIDPVDLLLEGRLMPFLVLFLLAFLASRVPGVSCRIYIIRQKGEE